MISGSASGVWTYSTESYTPSYSIINSSYPILKYSVAQGEDWVYDDRNIFTGSSKVTSIKYGTKDVKYVYLGDKCVYEYNTGTQKIIGSSYIVSHAFMGDDDTPYLSKTVSTITDAIDITNKMMLYEGFYIKPSLRKDGAEINTTISNFTVDVWIRDKKLQKLNYTSTQVYYYEDPDNVVGVYVRSGIHLVNSFIDTNDTITRLREGFLFLFNLN